MYFRIPLEQGLRHQTITMPDILKVFSYSIRTRIKTWKTYFELNSLSKYFRIPLEQGLRHRGN